MGSCSTCAELAIEGDNLSTHIDLDNWQKKKITHMTSYRSKRNLNMSRIIHSIQFPTTTLLLGIDRKNAIRIPHIIPTPKDWFTKRRLKYEVISLLNFGADQYDIYHGLDLYSHDCNTTITLLYNRITELSYRPPALTLHMDNCWRENKNKYVFAFCIYLVETDIF